MPYNIRMKDFEGFQLRARVSFCASIPSTTEPFQEALAACTRSVIREARLAEIKQEILRSKQLEAYFSKNPREKAALENDKKLYKVNLHSAAIADVPDYIVPMPLRGQDFSVKPNNSFKRNRKRKMSTNQKKQKQKNLDPLQSFKF